MTTAVTCIVFALCLVIGMPIAFVIGISAVAGLLSLPTWPPLLVVAQRMFTGIDNFVLLAIPFFMLAGQLMNKAGITSGLVKFSDVLVGHIRGGLAHVNIVASIFFAGITGIAVADTAALGSILIPAMVEQGYDEDFSAAVTAASSIIGPIIPPSIVMVLYAVTAGVSITGMFLAGFIPGVLIGLGLMAVSYVLAIKRDYPRREQPVTWRQFWTSLKEAFLILLMPIIILGGILSGIFTPTEAAAIGVAYGLVVGFFVTKRLSIKDLPEMLLSSAIHTGVILLIVSTAAVFSWLMATEKLPQQIANIIMSVSSNRYVVLAMINIFLLFVGCFMDQAASLIILVPILLPIAKHLDIHPIQFGIIVVTNLCIGLATPPVGNCLFVACSIADISLERISKAIWPLILVEIVVLFLITYVPAFSLSIPRVFGF